MGVVLKKMKYRQSVLYEFLDDDTLDRDVREGIGAQNLVSDADQLEFEDSQQVSRSTSPVVLSPPIDSTRLENASRRQHRQGPLRHWQRDRRVRRVGER